MLALTVDAIGTRSERSHCSEDIVGLVVAARRGERAAFARLHEEFAPMVHGVILARAASMDVVDLVQQTFLEALQRLHVLRDPAAFGGWIASIARNLATQSHRDRKRCQAVARDAQAPERSTIDRQEAEHVLQAIWTLPESYAETLVLRLVEGMTGPEIAKCTGLTEGSVRVNLHRGMEMLRNKLRLERCDET